MIDLKPMLVEMQTKVFEGDKRFEVLDAQHIVDTAMGIEYHLYDPRLSPGKPYKITQMSDGETVLLGTQLTGTEAEILDRVREQLHTFFTESSRKVLHDLYSSANVPAKGKMNVKPKPAATSKSM